MRTMRKRCDQVNSTKKKATTSYPASASATNWPVTRRRQFALSSSDFLSSPSAKKPYLIYCSSSSSNSYSIFLSAAISLPPPLPWPHRAIKDDKRSQRRCKLVPKSRLFKVGRRRAQSIYIYLYLAWACFINQ